MKHWHIWLPFLVGQFGFDFGGPGTFFGDVLAFIEGEIVAALSFLFNLVVAVANFLLAVDEFIFGFVGEVFRSIKNIWKTIWDNIVKITLVKILSALSKLRKIIATIVGRILCYFQAVRDILDFIFKRFIQPYLIMIQHVRQVLQLFRLLGFKWAKRLDARLAKIENDIVGVWELIRTHVNQVISLVQLVVDPFGILRRNPLLAAVLRDAPEIKNAIDRATDVPLSDKDDAAAQRARTQFSKAAYSEDYHNYFSKGLLPPDIAASQAQTGKELAAIQSGS